MINILLYFVNAFLSFQYILIKYQIGLPLYTIQHSHMKYMKISDRPAVVHNTCHVPLCLLAGRETGAPSKQITPTQCYNNVVSASQTVDQHCTTTHCPMLLKCWASVVASVLTQHYVSVSCSLCASQSSPAYQTADWPTFTDTFYTQ